MKRWTSTWAAMVVAGFLAVPAASSAQTAAPQTPSVMTKTTSTMGTAEQGTPEELLQRADAALNDIPTDALAGPAKTQITELKKHVTALQQMAAQPSSNGASRTSTSSWSKEAAAADLILSRLLAETPATATPTASTAAEPPATGTSGTMSPGTGAAMGLDEPTKASLQKVRTNLMAFATAMDRSASPETAPAHPQGQAETATAKQALTEARDTLSQLTQLPAAQQLTGESRTEVSQLISNFNELIAATSDWKGSYAKVQANLTSLLGAQTADAAEAAAPSATDGAVGTSGTATASLDPAVKAKLVEFRTQMNTFEKAAGGADKP